MTFTRIVGSISVLCWALSSYFFSLAGEAANSLLSMSMTLFMIGAVLALEKRANP
jgi:hypothetical protein